MFQKRTERGERNTILAGTGGVLQAVDQRWVQAGIDSITYSAEAYDICRKTNYSAYSARISLICSGSTRA